ncbi:MAG: IS630 family transposase [Hydrococcus sp. CSU_1_8]|jgi:transposase|nr:IS630 family transposase [Hydrococcus sp. CSU_1_8]
MTGVPKIEIVESAATLKGLMKQQKSSLGFTKIQALYLLKIKAVETIRHLAVVIGRGEATIHRWLHLYRKGGLEKLLEEHPKTGRPKKLPVETVAKLQEELRDREGFSSYQEVKIWALAIEDIQASYGTIHRLVRYELQGKLKVARPLSKKQNPGDIEGFKNQRDAWLKNIKQWLRGTYESFQQVSYWCQDETRLGLKTLEGRKLTLKGVKPIGKVQWQFDYYYVYGLVEPKGGRAFFYEFSHLNSDCFQIYLDKFSRQFSEEIHIIQLDNAPCHKANKLIVPDNVILLFQPPYCPEVNPIERFWEYLKKFLRWELFDDLEELRSRVARILNSLKQEVIQSLVGWGDILQALSLSGL